jgi:hypothetical protein
MGENKVISVTGKIGDDIVRIVVYTAVDMNAEEYFIKNEFLIMDSMDKPVYSTQSMENLEE